MNERNTAWLLAEWALWIFEGRCVDLRSKGTMRSVVPTGGNSRVTSSILDDDAMRVDRAMAKLRLMSPMWEETLWLTFVCDYSARRLASHFKITRYSAAQLYMEAYDWMDKELTLNILIAA